MEQAECDVRVVRHSEQAVLVTDDDGVEVWIPYSLITSDSEVTSDSDVDEVSTLIIPQWKAEEVGLV